MIPHASISIGVLNRLEKPSRVEEHDNKFVHFNVIITGITLQYGWMDEFNLLGKWINIKSNQL